MNDKAYLALDTSTDRASFALKLGQDVYTCEQLGISTHAQTCLTHIEHLLQKAHIQIRDLSGIIVGRGPGSFTGLRVASAVTKGLGYVHHTPVYAISNLQLLAWQAAKIDEDSPILTVMDARMQQVYWAYYPEVFATVSEQVSCISEITMPAVSGLVVAGFNIQDELNRLPQTSHAFKYVEVKPEASAMIDMVETGRIQAISVDALEPTYVRDQVTHGSING